MRTVLVILNLSFLLSLKAQETKYIPLLNKEGKWGYVSAERKMMIEHSYEEAWPFFKSGYAVVKKNGKYGFIDKQGNFVVEPSYALIKPRAYYERFYYTEKTPYGSVGFLNEYGKEAIPCVYTGFVSIGGCDNNYFCNGFATPAQGVPKIDTAGKILNSKGFDTGIIRNGLFPVFNKGYLGFMDTKGNILFKPERIKGGDEWTHLSEGLGAFRDANTNKCGYFNEKGNIVIPCKYEQAGDFRNGLAPVKMQNKWGYIDKSGKTLIPFQYNRATVFFDGIAYAEQGIKKMLIDRSGKVVKDLSVYEEVIVEENCGILNVKSKDGWGFMNFSGKLLTPCKFSKTSSNLYTACKNFIVVEKNNRKGVIDTTGSEIIPCRYKEIEPFYDNYFLLEDTEGKGLADLSGKILLPCKYSNIEYVIGQLAYVDIRSTTEKKGDFIVEYSVEYKNGMIEYYIQRGFVDLTTGKEYFRE